jgi:hypothetical protein
MANINKFFPTSPDTFLKAESDMALAKFGHLNAIVDAYNTLDTAVTAISSVTGVLKANTIAESTTGAGVRINGQELNIISGSGATVILTTQQSGSLILMDRAAGITFTLPVATSSTVGMYFDFVVTTSVTSNSYKVITGAATELLIGGYVNVDTDTSNAVAVFTGNGSTHISINMSSASTNATGGIVGTKLRFTCLSTTRWMVEGIVQGAGSPTTAFATT